MAPIREWLEWLQGWTAGARATSPARDLSNAPERAKTSLSHFHSLHAIGHDGAKLEGEAGMQRWKIPSQSHRFIEIIAFKNDKAPEHFLGFRKWTVEEYKFSIFLSQCGRSGDWLQAHRARALAFFNETFMPVSAFVTKPLLFVCRQGKEIRLVEVNQHGVLHRCRGFK
jgi:hypothetical protein